MTDYQNIINQIPIQFNLLSFLIFTGIVLGLMVSSTIFFKKKSDNQAVHFLGIIVLFLAFTLLDFFLSQTGLMKYVIRLNNSTEVFALLIPISSYFFILEILDTEKREHSNFKWHLIIPCLYFLTQIGVFVAPKVIQLNAYIGSFHPHLPFLEYDKTVLLKISFAFSRYFHHLMIGTFLVYLFFAVKVIQVYNQKIKQHFPSQKSYFNKYNLSIYIVVLLAATVVAAAIVFINYETDLGEQYLMLIPLAGIFALSVLMMSGAPIFDKTWLLEKYHTSGLNIPSSAILEKIIAFVEDEQYYLKKDGSLKDLATALALSPTYLSQVINNQTHQNFNDFINHYRIEAVKKRLIDEAYKHLTVAGIGETVGFKSKSSFYSVFKKHTDLTPAAYIKAVKVEKSVKSSPKS